MKLHVVTRIYDKVHLISGMEIFRKLPSFIMCIMVISRRGGNIKRLLYIVARRVSLIV